MPEISVVIITFNEEKNIGRCLESVKKVADEIVVLDSFSTDKTEQICATFGVKFFRHVFDGHIEQKNRAITYAAFPLVFSIDADEVLSETLIASILEVKKNNTKDGWYMNRLTNYCGKWIRHSGWYPDRKLRLFNSHKGACFYSIFFGLFFWPFFGLFFGLFFEFFFGLFFGLLFWTFYFDSFFDFFFWTFLCNFFLNFFLSIEYMIASCLLPNK